MIHIINQDGVERNNFLMQAYADGILSKTILGMKDIFSVIFVLKVSISLLTVPVGTYP